MRNVLHVTLFCMILVSAHSQEEQKSYPINGFLSTNIRNRQTKADHDRDLYETLSLEIGNNEKSVSAYFLIRGSSDLDGAADKGENFVFDSLLDSFKNRNLAQIYSEYADIHSIKSIKKFRIGRQTLHETPVSAYFDGVDISTDLNKSELGFYGGIPTHLYESSPKGDQIYVIFRKIHTMQNHIFLG